MNIINAISEWSAFTTSYSKRKENKLCKPDIFMDWKPVFSFPFPVPYLSLLKRASEGKLLEIKQ